MRKIMFRALCRHVRVDYRSDLRYNALSSASKLFPGEFLDEQRVRLIATSAWFIAGIMQRQASEWIHIVAQRVPNVSGRVSACAPYFFSVFNAVFSVWWTPCILHSYRKDKIFLRVTFIVRVFIIWKNLEFLKDLLFWKISDFHGILWVLKFDRYANFGDFTFKFKFCLFLKTLFLWSFFLDNANCRSVSNKYGIHPHTFTCVLRVFI